MSVLRHGDDDQRNANSVSANAVAGVRRAQRGAGNENGDETKVSSPR